MCSTYLYAASRYFITSLVIRRNPACLLFYLESCDCYNCYPERDHDVLVIDFEVCPNSEVYYFDAQNVGIVLWLPNTTSRSKRMTIFDTYASCPRTRWSMVSDPPERTHVNRTWDFRQACLV